MSPLSNRPLQPAKPPSSQHQPDEGATNVQNSAIDSNPNPPADSSSEASPPVAQRPLMRPVRPTPPPAVTETKAPESVVTPPPTQEASAQDVTPAEAPTQTELDGMRQQPIPAPSEPMQYRAIGLLRGRYKAEDEQFTRGTLTTTDGTDIQAVLLGRVMSLVRNHLDLEQDHLWVVYPRTREKEQDLHAQIVGVWEPEKLNKPAPEESTAEEEPTITYQPSSEVDNDYFSIRGEVIFQSPDDNSIVVKIQQAPRKKDGDRIKSFKLKLEGTLTGKVVGYFWDLQVRRQGDNLVIHQSAPIGMIPPKKRSNLDRGGDRPPRRDFAPRPGGGANRSPRPTPSGTGSSAVPVRKDPLPKPVVKKRDQVTEG
ncbi:MAG: hypothetical protein LH660_20875 [Phormidesmis sp. CAN_BIN36]|nr:hypothetical protein [Phormidesmis sp. CAN_BIN36]